MEKNKGKGAIKESTKPRRRLLNDQLSRAFKTPAQDHCFRLLNLSCSGNENGAYFNHFEKVELCTIS